MPEVRKLVNYQLADDLDPGVPRRSIVVDYRSGYDDETSSLMVAVEEGQEGSVTVNNNITNLVTETYPVPGPTGPQGPAGDQGLPGPQGIQGPLGLQGNQGIQGPTGPIGLTGSNGIQGLAGPQGLVGLTGSIGAQGVQGMTGVGAQGIQGIRGPRGLQGLQGDQGLKGDSGQPGTIYHTTTNVLVDGTVPIPGPTGPQGPRGIQGIQGPIGSSTNVDRVARALAMLALFGGSGLVEPIVIGPAGSTLTIIRGKKGDKGDNGYSPIKGVDYFDGDDSLSTHTKELQPIFYSTELLTCP